MVTARKPPVVRGTPGVSSVSDFKQKINDVTTLPSGMNVILKRTSIQTLMAQGMIPNTLMAIVQSAIAKGKSDVDVSEFLGDPQKMQEMLELMDIIAISCVKEPEVHPIPEDDEDRDDALLYVDELQDEDRSFIFQYATGGTKDVEQFRQETREQLATIQPSETVSMPAKRASRPSTSRGRR